MNLETLFHEALARTDPRERSAYLDEACAGNADLRAKVEALLAAHSGKDSLLDQPLLAPAESTGDFDAQAPRRPTTSDYQPVAAPGIVIAGRYTLEQQLGAGGMGEVWIARQTEPVKRRVAVKLIKAGMDSKAVLQRFEAERQALALMDHPHIAKVLDGGLTPQGYPFFVMELVNGQSLIKFCDGHKLSIPERLELFVPICQAVQHAHQKGIVHRDLKPGNILVTMIDGKPVPKVIDFGVAKAIGGKLTDESLLTQFGAVVGTLEYMAPEQAGYSGQDVDTRADIYSLGVILYELLTGLRPLDGKRLRAAAHNELIRIIREEEPSKPSTKLSTDESLPSLAAVRQTEPRKLMALLRGELDWVVMKCLEKDRNRRYETANGLARDIQRYMSNELVEARPPSFGYRAGKFLRRHKGAVVAASLILLALLGGFAGTAWGLVQALEAERKAKDEEAKVRIERDEKEHALRFAKEQLGVTAAICQFLQRDLLGQASPLQQSQSGPVRESDVKVSTLLDRASAKVGQKFLGQPVLEGAIRWSIGSMYVSLGRYADAEPHLVQAEKLFLESTNAPPENVLDCRRTLGYLYYLQGRHGPAETCLRQAHDEALRMLGSDHWKTTEAAEMLAMLYMDQGQLSKAELLLTAVHQTLSRLHGPKHSGTIACMRGLTRLYWHQGRHAEALPLEQEIVASFLATKGPDDPMTLVAQNDLAVTYQNLKRYDEAEALLQEVIKRQSAKIGPNHPYTLTSKHCLAVFQHDRGNYDRAISIFEETLKGWQTSPPGSQHRNMYNTVFDLAHNYRMAGRYADALHFLEEWIPRTRTTLGATHPMFLRGLRVHNDTFRSDRQFTRALSVTGELLALERTRKPVNPSDLASALALHGQNLLDVDKPVDAETAFRECLTLRDKIDPDGWLTFSTQSLVGSALLNQQKYAQAEPFLLQGWKGMEQRKNKIPPQGMSRLTEALERLAKLADATGKPEQAARWRKRFEETKAAIPKSDSEKK